MKQLLQEAFQHSDLVSAVNFRQGIGNVKNVSKNALLPLWRNTSTVMRNETCHFSSRAELYKTHTHTHTADTLKLPINMIIMFRNAIHQKDRWFESWSIKKCQSVEIKCFRTRSQLYNSSMRSASAWQRWHDRRLTFSRDLTVQINNTRDVSFLYLDTLKLKPEWKIGS
jgi:hypothetical protein